MLKQFVRKLPVYHQTETQKQFFAATFDQLFNPVNVEQAQGFIGRRPGGVLDPSVDIYLKEPNKSRRVYQLEPIAYTQDSTTLEDSNHVFYEDFINRLNFYGSDVSNHDRLFSDTYYSFAPPMDVDKFLNYSNYIWIEDGIPPVFISFAGSPAQFDAIIEAQIIGQKQFNTNDADLLPSNFQFTSGARVVFEGSAAYQDTYHVEGVGSSMRLVRSLSTQVPSSLVGTIPWDFGGITPWDELPWDSAGVELIPPQKDHITIERGSCNGNAWSRTNRWYHIEAINRVQAVGQVIDATIIDGGLGYGIGNIIAIEGDGTSADIEVTGVDGFGTITDFIIRNRGQGYSFAFIDDTGAAPLPGGSPWSPSTVGIGSQWDTFDWDVQLVPSSGTDAIFEIELASAVDRRNRGVRPILEYRRDLEMYNHGTRFTGEVDLVAETESLSDIIGQTTFNLDGIPLQDGMRIIFLRPSSIPSFLPWDEDPPAGPGTMSNWDTGPFDAQGLASATTRFVWHVSGVGTSITLERFNLATNTVDPGVPAAELGDSVLVRNGFTYAGYPFYQAIDEILGQAWTQGQTKVTTHTHPLFQLYDYRGIPLDDSLEFPNSGFAGNEIFSYRIYDGEALEANTFTGFDRILGFETIRKGLGQISDLIFENDLETQRTDYGLFGTIRTEIPGYYFFRELENDAACNFISNEYLTNWLASTIPDRQRVIDQFLVTEEGENTFTLTAAPVNSDVFVVVDGRRLGDDEYDYDAVSNSIRLFVRFELNEDDDLVKVYRGPPIGSIVETYAYTHGEVTDADFGFFEIPNGLENNPNNKEITSNSWNEFTSHFVSIIENQTPFFGAAFGVSNNYRDSEKDGSVGRFILQNQSPLIKAMLATSSEELDLVESMRMSSREYTRYKNKFLKIGAQLINEGYTPFNAGDAIPVNQWVDEAIRRILRTREFAVAFEDTYMAAWNNVFEEEQLIGNNVATTLTVTNFVDLEDKRNVMYIYIDGELLLEDRDYTIVNLNPIRIEFVTPPLIGNVVLVRLYENASPAHIPATPSKLGIYPVDQPRIEMDASYATPVEMLVGHDGSRTPTYGDYRDEMLLELEKRIYNGIISTFRGEYDPALRPEDVSPGAFRTTRWERREYEAILRQSFFKWAMQMRTDHRVNETFDISDEWSWNYASLLDKNGYPLPGYWRGIFDHYYDTQTPHITPWEMLGFNVKPTWWNIEYTAGPWTAEHEMWVDIENGFIRQGPRAGTDARFARPGLVANYLPVTGGLGGGALKATPMECIGYVGPLPTIDEASADWAYGDYGPVEFAWRTSEAYPFAVAETLFLTKPATFGEKFFNPENFLVVPINDLQVVSRRDGIFKRIGNSIQTVHGETRNGQKVLNTGYQVWISSRLKMLGLDVGREFGDRVRALDVKLGHKMAGFTDRNSLRTFVEGISATSTTPNLLVPVENTDVRLYTGAPVREYFYGGVVVKATEFGTYKVYGYDVLRGTFTYLERRQSANDRNINVAGQPENFINYESGRIYEEGTIIRMNGLFYRALVTHEATRFIATNWQKLSALPVKGGVNVTYKPQSSGTTRTIDYGHEFANPQEVFDFLIGWGDYLTEQGWLFENVNAENNTLENWLQSGKEFLFWIGTNWEAGSAIVLSPSANRTELEVKEGYPMSVEKITNGVYSILDRNGMAIDPINTKVLRSDRLIHVVPTIEGQEVYSLRVNTAETESIVTFDNETEFDDVLYDPLLGSRQVRLFLNGRRTLDWTGKLEAAGYIITENGLLQNFENLVDSVRHYHDTESTLDNPLVEATARHLIGFTERDYLNNLQVFDDAQFQFFKGATRQKGTRQSIDKLERSRIVTDLEDTLEVYEEWALKTGEFGGIANQQMTEFLLRANTIKVDPQLVELVYPQSKTSIDGPSTAKVARIEVVSASNVWVTPPPVQIQPHPDDVGGSGATAVSVLDANGYVTSIEMTTNGSGYRLPPRVSIGSVVPTAASDRAVAILEFDITPDVAGDDIITIDIDDNDTWITKPVDIAASETQDLWPTMGKEYWNVPKAGPVHYDDITHTIFDIRNLQDLWDRPTPPVNGSRIWTAKAENTDWSVYKMIPSAPVVRQFSSTDSELRLEVLTEVSIVNVGSGFAVDDVITVPALPGQITPATLRVTDVDLGGEILGLEVLTGGLFYDLSSQVGTPLGIGVGAEIEILEAAPSFFEEGKVLFENELPDDGPYSIRYLANKVFIDGTVYHYEQVDGALYVLSLDGEPIQDSTLNGTNEVPVVTDTSVFYSLRFSNITDWEENGDAAIVGANPDDDDMIWLESNARRAVISISQITAGVIEDGFIIVDGGFGYTQDGTIDVVIDGGIGGVLSYTVSPQTRSIISVSLVNGGSGYPDGSFTEIPVDAPASSDSLWRVKRVTGDGTMANTTLTSHRIENTLVDTSRFEGAYIYDVITKDTITQLPVYDPFKAILPGPADKNIRYRSDRDPARYTTASDARLVRPAGTFGAANVGELWWDTSTAAYIWYEQGDDVYRRDHWGELFPGSSIDVYEWTRSAVAPSEYQGAGAVRNITDYVERREWDPLLEEVRTFFYFWVKDTPVEPGIRSRSLSASEVARILRNPRSQLYRWYSPISQTGFVFSGVDGVFTDSDNIFQISYKRTEDDNRKHVEWELGREDDRSYKLKDSLWDKMTDSLVGFTQPVPINNSSLSGFPPLRNFANAIPVAGNPTMGYLAVPDPALNELNRYGIRRRPLQSMFKKRHSALRVFVQVVNELMSDVRLRDEDPTWNTSLTTNTLWEWVDWYAIGYNVDNVVPTKQVPNVGSLSTVIDILPGEIVKVTDTRPSFYTYNAETEQWVLIAKRDVRLQFKDEIFTQARNIPDSLELRELLDALKNRLFITDRFGFRNKLFFAMLNYIFQEQEDLDWAFKTTYVVIEQTGKRISTDRVFQLDPFDSVFSYIQEAKPYQTKVRDYKITRAVEIDDLPGTVREMDRLLSARMLYDRFRCSLSIVEMRIAKMEWLRDNNYDGYSVLEDELVNGEPMPIRLGAAGRFVVQQLDIIDRIATLNGTSLSDFTPVDAYWDVQPWDTDTWDGAAGTSQSELEAVAEINRRLHEEFRCYFEGLFVNNIDLGGTTTTQPWDSIPWDLVGWDANSEDNSIGTLEGSNEGTFANIDPEDTFAANGAQREFNLTTATPTYFMFVQVLDGNGDPVSTTMNMDYFFIGGRVVFITAPPAGYTINVYTYLEAGDFINPQVSAGITEEMVPLDPRENLVIVADTVDDPETPTVSYSFRVHYDTQKTVTYMRNAASAMSNLTAAIGQNDHTIEVDDVTVFADASYENPQVAWICNERIVYHGRNLALNLLLGVRRGTRGTSKVFHAAQCKIFGFDGHEVNKMAAEAYWISPAATNVYSGTNGQWRDNANGTAIFSDTANSAFAANSDPGDALRQLTGALAGGSHIIDQVASGSLSIVTITTPGSGYAIGDAITVPGNGTAVVGAVDGEGAVTAVTITAFGSGYGAGPETMTSAEGDGTFEATVVTNRQALVVAHPAPQWSVNGRVSEVNGIEWRIDTANPGGLLASTTSAATFILAQQGDALPCCPAFIAQWTTIDD